MLIVIRYLSLILVTLVVPFFVLETGVKAEQAGVLAAAAEPGDNQRKAILDALREEINQRHGRDVVFVVHSLSVLQGWAWLHALAQSADRNSQYGDVAGLLFKRGAAWEVLELPCSDANIPTCVGNAGYIEGLKQRFPDAPQALFADNKAQARPSASAAVISPTGTLTLSAEDTIDFDRDFRGLLHEPQILAEFIPTREQSREQPALSHSQLQSMTGTVQEIQTNHQELISRLAALDDELDRQRQATAQAHIARHALVSELSGLRDKVTMLTDALEAPRTTPQKPDLKFTDPRKELTIQGDAMRRFDSHITAIQSELASIHAQVSELYVAQQKFSDEAADSQEKLANTRTATQTQLQSIEKSLQELQTGGQSLTSELTKIDQELKSQGEALAQSNNARETLVAELATKKSLNEIAVTQQQFKEEQTATRGQLRSIEKSLQGLQTGGQSLTSELTKLGEEFDKQREANTQSDATRKALVDELANIRSKTVIADEAIKSQQAGRKKLDSQLVTLQQQIARQAESFTKSDSEIVAMRTELASISDQVKVLRKVQQDTLEQTAQAQEKLKQELSLAREELVTIAKSLQPASDDTQDLVSDLEKKMGQELEKQRQQFAQSDKNRRKLESELYKLRNKLGALDEAEQIAQVSRYKLSTELNALRQEVAATTSSNVQSSQKSAIEGAEITPKQSAKVDQRDSAPPKSDERRDLQLAAVPSRDEREPATAPHPPTPRTQAGASGTWLITPGPEGSDGQFTHRASGTIMRLPSRVAIPNTPGGPKISSGQTQALSDRNPTDETSKTVATIDLPAESPELPVSPQVANVTNVATIMDLNTLSDFDAIDPFLQAWTEDWERKDLEAYLAHYSSDFQPSGGVNRTSWRYQRRNSLLKPAFIDVEINNIQKRSTGAASAQLTFNQTYRSNLYSDQVVKTLDLRWEDERWKILKEQSQSVQ